MQDGVLEVPTSDTYSKYGKLDWLDVLDSSGFIPQGNSTFRELMFIYHLPYLCNCDIIQRHYPSRSLLTEMFGISEPTLSRTIHATMDSLLHLFRPLLHWPLNAEGRVSWTFGADETEVYRQDIIPQNLFRVDERSTIVCWWQNNAGLNMMMPLIGLNKLPSALLYFGR